MCDGCLAEISRRGVLKMAAGAVSTVILAGCGEKAVREALPDPPESYQFADLGAAGPALVVDPKTIPVPARVAMQKTDLGSIHPRSAWTSAPMALRGGVMFEDKVHPTKRDLVVVHHSGDGKPFLPRSQEDVIRHLEIVRRAHLQRGMIDIAYHFGVDPMGEVWQLRSLMYHGQHCRPSRDGQSWNSHSVGICVLGDFNLQPVGAAQFKRLVALAGLVREKYGIGAGGVKMHGELVETDCPGKALRVAVKEARGRKVVSG